MHLRRPPHLVSLAQRRLEVDVVLRVVCRETVLRHDELAAVRRHAVALLLRALLVRDGNVPKARGGVVVVLIEKPKEFKVLISIQIQTRVFLRDARRVL